MGVPPEIPKLLKFMEGHFGSQAKEKLFKSLQRGGITPQMLAVGAIDSGMKLTIVQHVMDDCFKEGSVQSSTKLRMIEAQINSLMGLDVTTGSSG